MKASRLLASLMLLAAPALVYAAAPVKAPTGKAPSRASIARDWSRTVAATPEGGVRMGNPDAAVKLVEFGSITCSHCADFNQQGGSVLRSNYVRSGRVSWEYRPHMIFPTDPGVFLLLNCVGPAAFFPAVDALYAQQGAWVGKLQEVPQAEQERIQALPAAQQAAALVRATGVERYFGEHGLSGAKLNACLADEARLRRLVEVSRVSSGLGVKGTPSFMLNGKLLEGIHSWEALEPLLKQSG